MMLLACVQIPNLAIAVARRDQPALADNPVVLHSAERPQALVAAASEETGIAPGMPLRQALVRCPHAVYRPADPEGDRQIITTLATLREAFSPRVALHALAPDAAIDLDLGRIAIPQVVHWRSGWPTRSRQSCASRQRWALAPRPLLLSRPRALPAPAGRRPTWPRRDGYTGQSVH
jgi:hypothetical protein